MSSAHASLALLERRVEGIGALLSQLLGSPPALPMLPDVASRSVLTTGVGASEGPARFLAEVLRANLGLHARFAPLSSFVEGVPAAADTLVVFSQGLSPNARLPLAACRHFAHRALFTSIDPDRDDGPKAEFLRRERVGGLHVSPLPPADESGMLLRVVGPAMALVGAMLWVEQMSRQMSTASPFPPLDSLPAALAAARARARATPVDLLVPRLALVSAGPYHELCHGLRGKLLEGLLCPEPPLWDAMGLAHGAFQQFYEERVSLIVLEGPSSVRPWLTGKLREILVADRHRVSVLEAMLPGPAGVLEHDAQLDEHVLAALRRSPRDLTRWPGQGEDGPLYGLGGTTGP